MTGGYQVKSLCRKMPIDHGTKNLKQSRPFLHYSVFLRPGTSLLLSLGGARIHFQLVGNVSKGHGVEER